MQHKSAKAEQHHFFAPRQCPGCLSDYDSAIRKTIDELQGQRAALLDVRVSGVLPSPLIYVGFGFGALTEKHTPYHGWIFGYNLSKSGVPGTFGPVFAAVLGA